MRLRNTRLADINKLQVLEKAAARRFMKVPELAFIAEMAVTDDESHRLAVERKLSWLVETEQGEIAGFCYCEPQEESLYLAEISTHPDFQRRGIGTQLLTHVREQAGRLGFGEITLTTWQDVAWNAPWYHSQGFEPVPEQQIGTGLALHLKEQREAGLMVLLRIAMRLVL